MDEESNIKLIEGDVNILTKSTDNLFISKDCCVKNENFSENNCNLLCESSKLLMDDVRNLCIKDDGEMLSESGDEESESTKKEILVDKKLIPSTSFEDTDTDSIFEIEDFTTVTEAEKLAAQLDHILRKHKISRLNSEGLKRKVYLSDSVKWEHEEDVIDYNDGKLSVTFTYLSSFPEPINNSPILTSEENDKEYFEIDIGRVSNFQGDNYLNLEHEMSFGKAFGIYGVVWISPMPDYYISPFNLSEIKQILSSVGLFDREYGCGVPIFCSSDIHTSWRGLGAFLENDKRIDFLQSTLVKPPESLRYLNGLKELFVEKINNSSVYPVDVFSTIKTRYVIYREQQFKNEINLREIIKYDQFIEYLEEDENSFKIFPTQDPIKEVKLHTEWNNLSTDLINESPLFSDLDPKMTSKWSLEVNFDINNEGYFYKMFSRMIKYHNKHKNTQNIPYWYCKEKLNRNIPYDITNDSERNDLNVINKNKLIFFENLLEDCNTNSHTPILQHLPQKIIRYVFDSCNSNNPIPKQNSQRISHCSDEEFEKIGNWKNFMLEDFEKYKSSKVGSLSERISIVIIKCLNLPYEDSYKLAAYVWMEFVNKLGKYFDEVKDIPGTEHNVEPNFNDCKLQQLLQLFQCCIDAKKRWYNYYDSDDFNNHDYDEFHDAEEEFQNIDEKIINNSSDEFRPIGRSHPIQGSLRLLNYDDRIMYVPFLQYPAPITEEQFNNQLCEDTELSRSERMKKQIIVLKSDMSAFKAANPGCCFEDFVRWHSPNDWILNEENGTYALSQRMTDIDNIWQLTWKEAPIAPITEQEHIFNETIEAYKILDILKDVNIQELINLVIPCGIKIGFKTLLENVPLKDRYSQEQLNDLQKYLLKTSGTNQYNVLVHFTKSLKNIQNSIFYYNSLKSLFTKVNGNLSVDEEDRLEELILKLINREDITEIEVEGKNEYISAKIPILGGPKGFIGQIVNQLATMCENINEGTSFPQPERKEYLLKCKCRRPHIGSRECNNRMYTIVDDDGVSWYLSMSSDIGSA
uniref:Rab3 GTPase-activating protein catalytic subunit n=1 Tax=Strongyloides papillosus TaxID=174720 RepID=A0A0N5BM10_STREA